MDKAFDLRLFYRTEIDASVLLLGTQKLAIEKWGKGVGGKSPSFFPKQKDRMFLLNAKATKTPLVGDCFHSLKTAQFFLPNVHGLILLEEADKKLNFLKNGSWVLGLDDLKHLSFNKKDGHSVPCLIKDSPGKYRYSWLPWITRMDQNEYILVYRSS